ncbi:MAG: hypothetical protein HOW97_24885 [Catenulispora sp.]|nr:hypothetical protein [Catenulispora sp.]
MRGNRIRGLIVGAAALTLGAYSIGPAQAALTPVSGSASAARTGAAAGADTKPSGPPSLARQEAGALDQARRTGQAVAVDGLTTETSRTVANPSGTFSVDQASEPVRVKRAGAWQNLDATLRANADGSVTPAVAGDGLRLSGGGTGPLAVMSAQGRTLSFSWPTALPRPTLAGSTATYADVIPGVDLLVTASAAGGFGEVLKVRTRQAAADPRLAQLSLGIEQSGGLTVSATADGALSAGVPGGEPLFTARPARMWDSAPAQPHVAAVGVSVSHPVLPDAVQPSKPGALTAAGTLHLVPDRKLLTDPATIFPVIVDPTWNDQWAAGSRQKTAQVDTISSSPHINTSELQNGYDGWSSGMVARDFLQFSVPTELQNSAHIYHSYVYLTVQHGPYNSNCSGATSPGFAIWWTNAISSSTVWSNQPSWRQNLDTQNPKACDGQNVRFDVTSFIQANAPGSSNMTFGLRASSESDKYAWKEITTSTVRMTTEYDHAPDLPKNAATSPGGACATGAASAAVIGNDDVVFSVVPTDRDGGTLGTEFVIKDSTGATRLDTGAPATAPASLTGASGSTFRLVVPRTQIQGWHSDGTTAAYQYSWYTVVSDGNLTSPATGAGSVGSPCVFTYDPSAPNAPTITAPDGSVTFGQRASFTIAAAPGTNPSRYTYQLDDGPTQYAEGGGASQTVWISPTRVGTNTLSVTALSAAGNPSAMVTTTFTVLPPTKPYADGDIDGDGVADLLSVGTSANAGLWLSPGTGGGHLAAPTNIGVHGVGLSTTASPAEWSGAQVLHGDFTGDHVQDVIAYQAAGANSYGALLYGNGDRQPLLATSGNQKNLNLALLGDTTINADANGGNGDYPTRLVAAGNASLAGDPVPDLIGVAGDGGANNYELDLYTGATVESYGYTQTLAAPGASPDGTSWNNFVFAVAQPVGPVRQSVLFALDTTTGGLWEAVNTTDGTTTTWTGATPTLTWTRITGGPWGAGTGPALAGADVTSAGAVELWTRNGQTATAYTLSGTALAAGASNNLNSPTHQWPLTDGAGTTAADTAATGTGNATLVGGVSWTGNQSSDDPVHGTVAAFDGKTGYLRLPDNLTTGATALTLSLSFQAQPGHSGILFATGQGTPDTANPTATPVMYIGTDGRLYAQFTTGAVTPISSPASVADGQWHTATLVGSGASQTLYLDDHVPVVLAGTAAMANTDTEAFVGAGVFNTKAWLNAPGGTATAHANYFTGQISDVEYYAQVLSPALLAPHNVPTDITGTMVSGVSPTLCLDDRSGGSTDGTVIQVYACNATGAQNFTLYPDGTVRKYGKCLDITGGASATANGTKVELWTCLATNGAPNVNQTWQVRSDRSLFNPNSGKCLDDPNSTTTNSTQVQIYTCNGTGAQKWTAAADPVVTSVGTVVAALPTPLCVDNAGGTATSPGGLAGGNKIQLWTCNGYPSQQWSLNPEGTITLYGYPGKCLDVTNSGTADGTKIQLQDCHVGGSSVQYQQWQTGPNSELWNSGTGKCLDSGAGTAGTQLQIWTCNNTKPQSFNVP